ncbi:sigma-70 RNA polymerase sigma factor region 4 domain-containing protein [Amycolatopsis samaneae]|uniref:Uncharacterized protein n=1 Tax=Amycolatopsis samaneae TaxID=664691 RepID=A0ABW5GV79_9PSEU
MVISTSRFSNAPSPLSMLQTQFERPPSILRFDTALRAWSTRDPALATITSHTQLGEVLATRDYVRHDEVLFTLVRRAATVGEDGLVAAELVMTAMLAAVPGITGRVLRACQAATGGGVRRGLCGAGVSATEDVRDVQATVIGHLWERVRSYPLRRRHHVAANLVRDTQRAVLRSFGVDLRQAAAHVVSFDAPDGQAAVAGEPVEVDASEELLELLAWAVEEEWLAEKDAAILTARYFGDQVGRDGVATDRQVAAVLEMTQSTVTRHRQRACRRLAAAAREFPGSARREAG